MRIWLVVGMLLASTVSAYAAFLLPEIDATSGLAARLVSQLSFGSNAGANTQLAKRGFAVRIWLCVGILFAPQRAPHLFGEVKCAEVSWLHCLAAS